MKFETFNEITHNSLMGALFLKTPPMGISSQNTLLNNFSLVQLILACNIPIDSAQQA
jgi:hypothetical protein